jgi:hypothetical protein
MQSVVLIGSMSGFESKIFSTLNFTFLSKSPKASLRYEMMTVNGVMPFISARQSDCPTFCLACRPILTLNLLNATPSPPVQYDMQHSGANIVNIFFFSWEYSQRKQSFVYTVFLYASLLSSGRWGHFPFS